MIKPIKRITNRIYNKSNALIFGRKSAFQAGTVTDLNGMKQIPFSPENVLEGSPAMRTKLLTASGDGGFMTGLWDCSAGRFLWHFHCDEVVQILEGDVFVDVKGKKEHLTAGSVAFFPIGTVSEWHVPNYVLKSISHRHPTPTIKRMIG